MKNVAALTFNDNIPETEDLSYDISEITEISAADQDNNIDYKDITLKDRCVNRVKISCDLDELRLVFPDESSNKIRDFELYIEVGSNLSAPSLSYDSASGIKLMNEYKEVPEIAAGTISSEGRTILYFSEISPSCFLLKGEQLEVILTDAD